MLFNKFLTTMTNISKFSEKFVVKHRVLIGSEMIKPISLENI